VSQVYHAHVCVHIGAYIHMYGIYTVHIYVHIFTSQVLIYLRATGIVCVIRSLPGDYNSTAIRLQTLIGASDYMIQWVLTGDMSQVHQHIYQIVLIKMWCQPHFIKFCDIMEVTVSLQDTLKHW